MIGASNTSRKDPSPSALILVPCCQPVEPDREGSPSRNHAAIPVVVVREWAVSRHVGSKRLFGTVGRAADIS